MDKIATFFIMYTIIMVNLLQRSTMASASTYRYCTAWVAVDGISQRNYHRQQRDQILQRCRHCHHEQQRYCNRLRHLDVRRRNADLGTILPMSSAAATTTTSESSRNPSDQHKNEINQRIYNIANTTCHLSPNQITITWKPKRIVVTVHTENAYIDSSTSDGDDVDENEMEIDFVDEEEFMDDNFENDHGDDEDDLPSPVDNSIDDNVQDDGDLLADPTYKESTSTSTTLNTDNDATEDDSKSVDLSLLARSINAALDDGEDGIGTRIAQLYEIEVSTPGVTSDDITSPRMFAAYRGFDVIVSYLDPKKKVMKQHEGRLVEKNEEYVIINQKGRMKHFKNIHVQAVKLPKFKSEKGVR